MIQATHTVPRAASQPALRVYRATSFFERLSGVWRRPLADHEALWLTPCKAVHTFGLSTGLDVLFLDDAGRVLREIHRMAPNRCAWHARAHSVIELRGGYIRRFPDLMPALREAMGRM